MKKISFKEIEKDFFSILFEGFVDSDNSVSTLNSIFDQLLNKNAKKIVIDLQRADYINSAILGILMKYYRQMPATSFFIICNNPYIKDLLKITALDKFFTYIDEKEVDL